MQACDWTMEPWLNGHNATKTSCFTDFFVSFMIYDMTKMCFVIYSSKNSLMSSLFFFSQDHYPEKLLCIVSCCLSLDRPYRSYFLSPFCFNDFYQVNSFLLLVCYSLTSHITKHNNCQTVLSMFSTILPGVFHVPKFLHETVLITC